MTNQFASMFCRLSLALRLAVMVVILLPAGSRAGYASSQTERLARVCTAVHGAPPATLSRYCAARGW